MLNNYLKSGWKILCKKESYVIVGKDNGCETIPMHKELKKGLEKYLFKRLYGGK